MVRIEDKWEQLIKALKSPRKNNMTKHDVIEAYIEMRLRDCDLKQEMIKDNDPLLTNTAHLMAEKKAYGDVYKFLGTLRIKEQQIQERNLEKND